MKIQIMLMTKINNFQNEDNEKNPTPPVLYISYANDCANEIREKSFGSN